MAPPRFILFPVGATPESIRTQIGAVGPAPVPGSVPNPSFGDVPTWNGTTYAPQPGGGGGGGVVIPDGGTIEGIYNSDVLCLDSATMTGEVTINGKLIVIGTLTNSGGFNLTIRADLNANTLNFTQSNPALPQGGIVVDGDLIAEQLLWVQTGGIDATLRVGGDLLGKAGFSGIYIDAHGSNDSPGATIVVYGEAIIGQLNLYGGDSVLGSAGRGGNAYIFGNLTVLNSLFMYGGSTSNTGFDAGQGGELRVYGSVYSEDSGMDLSGGSGTEGNGGPGGQMYVGGFIYVSELQMHGGYCSSNNENHVSGRGGDLYVGGGFTSRNYVNLSGGQRDGTLSAGASGNRPDGGSFQAYGNVSIDEYDAYGGSIYTNNFSPCRAGTGGYMDIEGNLDSYYLGLQGGSSFNGNGDAGDANENYVKGSLTIGELSMAGGTATNGNAGGGGYFEVDGNAAVDNLYANGGSATNGNGGNGGYFYCSAYLSLTYADMYGGNCDSANETHYAQSGGNLSAKSINAADSSLYLDGGDRSGNTTVSNTGNNQANGGEIQVEGDFHCYFISGEGGDVNTNFPNSRGGDGTHLNVSGAFYCTNYARLRGGHAVGNNGGRGGSVAVRGHATITNLEVYGGDSNNSAGVGADATVNGAGASSTYFPGGLTLSTLIQRDGVGLGTAPTDSVIFEMSGSCHVRSTTLPNRPAAWIRMTEDFAVTLKLDEMNGKVTLNDFAGVETSDISALLGSNLFFAGAGSSSQPWVAVTGLAI